MALAGTRAPTRTLTRAQSVPAGAQVAERLLGHSGPRRCGHRSGSLPPLCLMPRGRERSGGVLRSPGVSLRCRRSLRVPQPGRRPASRKPDSSALPAGMPAVPGRPAARPCVVRQVFRARLEHGRAGVRAGRAPEQAAAAGARTGNRQPCGGPQPPQARSGRGGVCRGCPPVQSFAWARRSRRNRRKSRRPPFRPAAAPAPPSEPQVRLRFRETTSGRGAATAAERPGTPPAASSAAASSRPPRPPCRRAALRRFGVGG